MRLALSALSLAALQLCSPALMAAENCHPDLAHTLPSVQLPLHEVSQMLGGCVTSGMLGNWDSGNFELPSGKDVDEAVCELKEARELALWTQGYDDCRGDKAVEMWKIISQP